MRHARRWRAGLGVLLAGYVSLSSGCTHNHYYGASVPVCGPTVVGSTGEVGSEYGAVCEVPNQVVSGGSVVAQRQPGVTVVPGPKAPRVVVSEPRGNSRLAWRRSDPEDGLATTRVEGALNDPTVTR
jgi:hypothetical protein